MNKFKIKRSKLEGEIVVPPSKSHTLRAILFASLAHGRSTIRRYLPSTDAISMIEACKSLGARIDVFEDYLEIDGVAGVIRGSDDVINAGNSGIVLRFISAVCALGHQSIVITGDHSIRHQRPMQVLLDALGTLGASAISTKEDGFAPLVIKGPLKPSHVTVVGQDSQYVSALLIALAFAPGESVISVIDPGEKPWVALTLSWFDRLGITYHNDNFATFRLPGGASIQGFDYEVPGDVSSAAFSIVSALVTNSDLLIRNVDMSDVQGDKELIYVLQKMGAKIDIHPQERTLFVNSGSHLCGRSIDINDFIDSITILAVVGCFAEGETHLCNAAIARNKECNRIESIVKELKKMGADITSLDDGLIVKKSSLKANNLFSYNDHRMCMSLAVAAMGAEGISEISPIDCINKTYPSFIQDFNRIGAAITPT